jgi:bifunctional non-homologous end joining protein LigD
MSLREYARKRSFGQTPEPDHDATTPRGKRPVSTQPIFVVQLHNARARHYDFRLEVDGALKSWAVPKGPSLRPGDKRLAVEVEDHPLSYAGFEGEIPQGNYGAGHVLVFDHGTWSTDGDPLQAIAAGKLDFTLHGKKLRGDWKLVRTRLQGGRAGNGRQWLLIKRDDAYARDAEADDMVEVEPGPASSQKAGRKWISGKREAASTGKGVKPSVMRTTTARKSTIASAAKSGKRKPSARTMAWRAKALAFPGARDRSLHRGFKPQLTTLREAPPRGDDWLHEVKWDGYRLLADVDDGRVRLRSRNGLDWTTNFPGIASALEALPVANARFDGELVALDSKGRSDFAALQRTIEGSAKTPLRYLLFDLPALEGVDLTHVALVERKQLLESLLARGNKSALAFSVHVIGHGPKVFAASAKQGLEGIISKRVDSHYVERRSPDWIKTKHSQSDEFLIVGYTNPKGSRAGFGSLLMATIRDGALHYVGRVGTGYDDATLRSLARQLHALRRDTRTVELPPHVPFAARDVTWVEPELVAEIAFRGWGKEGLLRQASFMRLRDDKTAEDVGMTSSGIKSKIGMNAKPARNAKRAESALKHAGSEKSISKADGGITHPERIVYPRDKVSKGDVADYYRAIAPWILPELANRPLSLVRCPDGLKGQCFFQKHHAATLGKRVHAIELSEKDGEREPYVYIKDADGLLELVQMNTLEFHPWGARVDRPEQPDRMVFDLDPADGVEWKAVVAAARDVRARLLEAGLQSWVRLSGGKGLHVVVPIKRGPAWTKVKAFCEAFADALAAHAPLTYLATASKAQRKGRIFIDWLRNARGATSVTSWSLRARDGAPVAMPLAWTELARVSGPAAYDIRTAQKRAASLKSDPWADLARCRQSLPTFPAKPR